MIERSALKIASSQLSIDFSNLVNQSIFPKLFRYEKRPFFMRHPVQGMSLLMQVEMYLRLSLARRACMAFKKADGPCIGIYAFVTSPLRLIPSLSSRAHCRSDELTVV